MRSRSKARPGALGSTSIGSAGPRRTEPGHRTSGESDDVLSSDFDERDCLARVGTGLVSLALLFPHCRRARRRAGVPPSSMLERADRRLVHAVLSTWPTWGMPTASTPSRRRRPWSRRRFEFGEGRPEETVRLPGRDVAGPRMRHQRQLALANALFMDVQEAKQRTGDGQREPVGSRVRPPSLHVAARLPECDALSAAASDSGDGSGARGDREAPGRRGLTSLPSRCSPPPSGSEITRATASERRGELPGRPGGRHARRVERLLFSPPPTRRPLGLIRDRGRLAGILEPAGLRARSARLFRLDAAGPTRA